MVRCCAAAGPASPARAAAISVPAAATEKVECMDAPSGSNWSYLSSRLTRENPRHPKEAPSRGPVPALRSEFLFYQVISSRFSRSLPEGSPPDKVARVFLQPQCAMPVRNLPLKSARRPLTHPLRGQPPCHSTAGRVPPAHRTNLKTFGHLEFEGWLSAYQGMPRRVTQELAIFIRTAKKRTGSG